jgi:hypothetical protein
MQGGGEYAPENTGKYVCSTHFTPMDVLETPGTTAMSEAGGNTGQKNI